MVERVSRSRWAVKSLGSVRVSMRTLGGWGRGLGSRGEERNGAVGGGDGGVEGKEQGVEVFDEDEVVEVYGGGGG